MNICVLGLWHLGSVISASVASKGHKVIGIDDNTKKKCFKNKIRVKLLDNNYLTAHLIHWVPSDGYFFVTQDKFWDKFDNENNNNLDEKSELNNKITPPFPPE